MHQHVLFFFPEQLPPCALPALPWRALACSFNDLVASIDQLLASGEEATVAAPAPLGSWGPCKDAADKAAVAAAAAAAAAALGTPPQQPS